MKLTKVQVSGSTAVKGVSSKPRTMKMPYKHDGLWYDIWQLDVPEDVFRAWRRQTYGRE